MHAAVLMALGSFQRVSTQTSRKGRVFGNYGSISENPVFGNRKAAFSADLEIQPINIKSEVDRR